MVIIREGNGKPFPSDVLFPGANVRERVYTFQKIGWVVRWTIAPYQLSFCKNLLNLFDSFAQTGRFLPISYVLYHPWVVVVYIVQVHLWICAACNKRFTQNAGAHERYAGQQGKF